MDTEALGGAELYSITTGIAPAAPATESQERMVPEAMGSELGIAVTESEARLEVVVIEHVQEMCFSKLR